MWFNIYMKLLGATVGSNLKLVAIIMPVALGFGLLVILAIGSPLIVHSWFLETVVKSLRETS